MLSRFQKEISGELGEWWKRHAEEEVKNLVSEAKESAIVEEDGSIRWKSSGNYLPDDCCEKLFYAGYAFSPEKTAEKRNLQQEAFLKEYRANPPKLTEEDLCEMRAAFGTETEVVDIITEQKIVL